MTGMHSMDDGVPTGPIGAQVPPVTPGGPLAGVRRPKPPSVTSIKPVEAETTENPDGDVESLRGVLDAQANIESHPDQYKTLMPGESSRNTPFTPGS
jgi:hypothetical protein